MNAEDVPVLVVVDVKEGVKVLEELEEGVCVGEAVCIAVGV